MIFVLQRLTACFSGPLRRLTAYFSSLLRRLTACFSAPFSLTFSAKSANLGVKGGQLEFLNLFTMFRKLISFIYEFFFQGDRVPLSDSTVLQCLVHFCLNMGYIDRVIQYSIIITNQNEILNDNRER